jgi:hypothetical protein
VTIRKTKTTRKGQAKKLKLKKETLKDLDARQKSKDVKAGRAGLTDKTICGPVITCI